MKLLSLVLVNFRQHADSSITFPAHGVVGILGANESGKSTILEAIGWALYGADAIRQTMSTVRWKRAAGRRQAEVMLVFEVAGQRYRVERSERDAQLIEARDHYQATIASGTAAVNAEVPKLLGMGWAEFRASYLAAQKDLARIAAMKPTERQAFVREVLGIGRIDAALERCRARKNDLSREVAGAQAGLGERAPLVEEAESAERAVSEAEGAVQATMAAVTTSAAAARDAAEALSASEIRRRRHEDLTRRRDEAARERDSAQAEIEKLTVAVDAAHLAQAKLREQEPRLAELPALRAERETICVAEARAGERRAVIGRLEGRVRDAGEYRRSIEEYDAIIQLHDAAKLRELVERFTAAEAELRRRREDRQSRIGAARTEARQASEAEQAIRQQIKALRAAGPDDPCPMCTRPLGEHFGAVLVQLDGEARGHDDARRLAEAEAVGFADPEDDELELEASVAEMRSLGEELRGRRDRASVAVREREAVAGRLVQAEQDVRTLEVQLAGLPGAVVDAERLARCDARIREIEALDASLAPLRAAAGRIQVLLEQVEQWRARRESAVDRCAAASTDLEQLHFHAEHHAELLDAEATAGRLHMDAEKAYVRAAADQDAALQRSDRATRALQDYDTRAAGVRKTADSLRVHERAAEAINRFRIAAAARVRPELEELMSGFVAVLTDGRHESVALSDDFAATLHEGGVPVEVVSGGTEDVAALALRLAISQLISERAGHPLSLLILDEPFGGLDETRRANVLALIRRLGKVFEQVLLISHIEETRTAVDHAIEIEYDEAEGRSIVRQQRTVAPEEVEAAA